MISLDNNILLQLNPPFFKYGWSVQTHSNSITYIKTADETSKFEIHVESTDRMVVSVPLKNSIYQYVTIVKDVNNVVEYVEQKLIDYEERV